MAKKYVASSIYDFLGQMYETEEEAVEAARGIDYTLDARTGYSTAFNCEPEKSSDVREIDDHKITFEEYKQSLKEYEKAKEQFEKEVEQLREKRLGKYIAIKVAYINLNTPYGYGDKIRLITLKRSGRKRKIEATVCGVFVCKETGELRPDLYGMNYPVDEPIVSIEVLEHKDFTKVRPRIVCHNCKHYDGNRYDIGTCLKRKKVIYSLHENEYDCYENDPTKK